jgi:transcriptional regulator with XRE-family HTH domain
MDNKAVIKKIKEARESKKITQSQMAERLNMGYRAYQNFEACFTKKLDLERLRKVSNELDLDFVQLFETDNVSGLTINAIENNIEDTLSNSVGKRSINVLRLVAENAGMRAENNLLKAEILFLRQIVSKQVLMYLICFLFNQSDVFCIE